MIIFADSNIVPYLLLDRERYFILNFFNITGLGERIDALWPPNLVFQAAPSIEDAAFDGFYVNYVLNNDEAFQAFMEITMASYYNNDEVFVLTDFDSPPVVAIIECVIKLIQARYGYTCYIANSVEDLNNIPESEMSDSGVYNFMIDKERYTRLSIDPKELLENIEVIGNENDGCI